MKVLVTAATKYGATAEIARAIGDTLHDHGLDPTVIEPEQVGRVDEFDAVVLGSAVYAGHWLKPASALDDRFQGILSGHRRAGIWRSAGRRGRCARSRRSRPGCA